MGDPLAPSSVWTLTRKSLQWPSRKRSSSEIRFLGEVRGDVVAVVRLTRKIVYSYPYALYTYEAGGRGSDCIANSTGLSHHCVVARSKISRVVNDRIKNDRRDPVSLARLLRAGELSPVWVPDEGHEAICDLVRARHCAAEDLRKARQRIQSFLLRHRRHSRLALEEDAPGLPRSPAVRPLGEADCGGLWSMRCSRFVASP